MTGGASKAHSTACDLLFSLTIASFWLPDGGHYTAEIQGTIDELITVQVLIPVGNSAGRLSLFEAVHLAPGSLARLAFAKGNHHLTLQIDQDGDGLVDEIIEPGEIIEIGQQPNPRIFLPLITRN